MIEENIYTTQDYLNPSLLEKKKKFIKVYSYYSNDAEKKAIAGFVYDLEQSLGQFTYNVLTNTIEYYNYSYPLTVAAATSTDGKELISQINMRADPTNDMEIATKHYVDSSISANSVLYTAQSLTEEQKAQARQNIGSFDIFDLPNLIKFDVKSKPIFGDKIVEGQVFALNDFQPIDIDTADAETIEAWRIVYNYFSLKPMQKFVSNIST